MAVLLICCILFLPLTLLFLVVFAILSCIGCCISKGKCKLSTHTCRHIVQEVLRHALFTPSNEADGKKFLGATPAQWQNLKVVEVPGSKIPLEDLWRGPTNAITVIAFLRHIG